MSVCSVTIIFATFKGSAKALAEQIGKTMLEQAVNQEQGSLETTTGKVLDTVPGILTVR